VIAVTGLDRDVVFHRLLLPLLAARFPDVHHFTDDTARRDDAVTLAQVTKPVFMLPTLLLLRPDHQKVEDRKDRSHLDQER
jgi:hypothetical protein